MTEENNKEKLVFPQGYKITDKTYGPDFADGHNLLRDYCGGCLKGKECEASKLLRHAMGENFPFWHKSFLFIEVPTEYRPYDSHETKVMCADYKSRQEKLELGIKGNDGVERLVELAEKEKQEYLERHAENNSTGSIEHLETGTIENIE